MKTTNSQTVPAPPHFVKIVVAGFDTITNHIFLIILPIGLDLLIWLAPRLSVKGLIDRFIGDLVTQSLLVTPDLETTEMLESAQELWQFTAEHFNLLVFLRSYPVGIPSLMVSLLPMETPVHTPTIIEFGSIWSVAFSSILLAVIGLVFGTLYFSMVAQAAVSEEIVWRDVFTNWPRMSLQVILLALTWLFLFVGVSVPASCAISFAALSNMAFGQCAILLYGGFVIWMIFPLLFSPHGIFVGQQKVWPSIRRGIHITRMTLPTASLFFMTVLMLTQLSDLLWRIPPANSWLMLIGLAGHAFVSTGFLSASFIYYHQADLWIKEVQAQMQKEASAPDLTA